MKPQHCIGLAALALFFSACTFPTTTPASYAPSPVSASVPQAAAEGTVSATGDAEVRVVPDEVVLTLGVETFHRDLGTAKTMNDTNTAAVIKAAREQSVAEKDIQTDYFGIDPRYQDEYEHRNLLGYVVRKTIQITLRDPARFEDLLSEALAAGANYVHGVEFRTSELRKYRDQARELAIQAAREKAAALASALGREIGAPLSIIENRNQWWSGYSSWWGGWGAAMSQNVVQNAGGASWGSEGPTAPGQISVQASVSVQFTLR